MLNIELHHIQLFEIADDGGEKNRDLNQHRDEQNKIKRKRKKK